MNGLLLVLALYIAGSNAAVVLRPRISGGTPVATGEAPHACIIFVIRPDIAEGEAAFGGGSIVARNRVITAAHVVRGATPGPGNIQVGYWQGTNFRRADGTIGIPAPGYEADTFLNDIAVIQFSGNPFPEANIIPISISEADATGAGFVVGFGFTGTAPAQQVPVQTPNLADQSVVAAGCDTAVINSTESHFCAMGTAIICPGDNGCGFYTGTAPDLLLVGVVSVILPGCETAQQTAYTNVGLFQYFLESQGVDPPTPAPAADPAAAKQ